MANALMNYINYNGQQVRNDDQFRQNQAENLADYNAKTGSNLSLMDYDKMLNPTTYGARWGIAAPSTAPAAPATQQASPTAAVYTSAPLPTYTPYKSAEFNFEADPGYAFRKAEGEKALQAKQLASGNFFSGGALKEATDFNSGLASQEYGNAFNRYMGKDAADFRTHQANFGNEMSRWSAGDNAAFRNNSTNYDRAWNTEMRDYNRFNDQFNRDMLVDNTNWGRLQYLDQSGQNAATQTANFGQNTANNVGNLQVGAGTAQGGGYINSANAWTNALGNALYSMRNNGGSRSVIY